MINLSNEQLLSMLTQLKSNSILLDEILDELTIRKHLTYLNESYIDEMLDTYNEYKRLFELTNDERYADKMFAYEAEFYKVTYWAYDVLQDKDVSGYKRSFKRCSQTTK